MMKSFAELFFTRFGAAIQPAEDELVVDLPPELVSSFGKPRLYLVFTGKGGKQRELSSGEDLLVYGSRTFDQMLSLLNGRGEMAHFCLPNKYPAPSGNEAPLPLHNCRQAAHQAQVRSELFYVVNFRSVYVSDEKVEEVTTVVLDAEGEPRPHQMALLHERVFPALEPPLRLEADRLRSMLDRAAEVTRQQVDGRAGDLEEALRARLRRALRRLAVFYRRLLDEVDTGDVSQDESVRAGLNEDLHRKIADEVERHRLRVTVTPLSCAVALTPVAHHRLTLATRHSQQSLTLVRNLYTGQIDPVPCHHCGEPLDRLALCDGGHVVHPGCVAACARCGREVCRSCGIEICAICGKPVCGDCTAACAHCDSRLCAAHVHSCPICGQPHCTTHSVRCRWCQQLCCNRCGAGSECETCRQALAGPASESCRLALSELETDRYEWRQAKNQTFEVYIGRRRGPGLLAPLLPRLVLVTDQAGNVLHRRQVGSLERLRELF